MDETTVRTKMKKQKMMADFLFRADHPGEASHFEVFPPDEIVDKNGMPAEIWYKGKGSHISGLLLYEDDAYATELSEDDLKDFQKRRIRTRSYEELRKRTHHL